MPCSPVAGSRVNATPVAEVSPMFPKTIRCTVTAVPKVSGIPYSLRYAAARSPIQESKTAPMASSSCSLGSSGKPALASRATMPSNRSTNSRRSGAVSSVSASTPRSRFISSMASSKRCPGTFKTISPKAWMKRRYES